jgi:hypothetical protein
MTLAKHLNQALNDPANAGSDTVSASAGPWQATASTAHRDKIGAEINELTVERATSGPGNVKGWADNFADRSHGLLEPLKVIEVDNGRDEAMIRSSPPKKADGNTDYYEVKMQATEKASVKRYRHDGGGRQEIPFTLTHDGIRQLVDDLTGSQGG